MSVYEPHFWGDLWYEVFPEDREKEMTTIEDREREMTTIQAFSWDAPVLVDGDALDLGESLAVMPHSPSGFSWGYKGSGCAQLALAILLRFTDPDTAVRLHQQFKEDFVATWPQTAPLNERVNVRAWLATHRDGAAS